MRVLSAAGGNDVEGPAIKALGPLFKVTEVYLWDDAKVRHQEATSCADSSVQEISSSSTTVDACSISSQSTEYDLSMEDLELASQMAALGLPNSFSTNKEKNVSVSGRRVRVKDQVVNQNFKTGSIRFPEAIELENLVSFSSSEEPNNLLVLRNQPEVRHEREIDFERVMSQEKDEKQLSSSSSLCNIVYTNSDTADQACAISIDSSSSCTLTDHSIQAYPDNATSLEFGEWSVIWDNFYSRNYFFNSQTQESTWYPPPGLEHLSFPWPSSVSSDSSSGHVNFHSSTDANQDQCRSNSKDEFADHQNQDAALSMDLPSSNTLGTKDSDNHLTSPSVLEMLDMRDSMELTNDPIHLHLSDMKDQMTDCMLESCNRENVTSQEALYMLELTEEVLSEYGETNEPNQPGFNETESNPASTLDDVKGCHEVAIKNKRRAKRMRIYPRFQGTKGDLSADLEKYWCQRYSLFSLFDSGIKMDEEGWFSVTPEAIARHHAYRCARGVVIDCFAGVGGNTIQYAAKSNYVISIDLDPLKVEFAEHNATIYGVSNKIDFIVGDFFKLANCLKGDTVFLSPPWGGPDYVKVETYDIKSMLKPHDGFYLLKVATAIAPRVVLYLPRNVDMNQLAELCLSINPPWTVEVEKNILNGKFKAVTAYFTRGT